MTRKSTEFSDETLTAYLDGELDAATVAAVDAALATDDALQEHLATLDFPVGTLRDVLSPDMLGAPALPETLISSPQTAPANAVRQRPRSFLPLALVASFLVGMVATTLIQPLPEQAPSDWTAAVASYQALYVTETLDGPTQAADLTEAVLSRAADEFDVSLVPAIQIEGIACKRAQMLGFQGKPLLQVAYLTAEGTPFALCLIETDKPDRGTNEIEMFDLAGVSWVKDGVGYFLIGGDDADLVADLSAQMIEAL